ncbi:MAG: hypothetical protein HZC55_07140 [Verrucomicrobia bacterium]|nr:hypothetical protein [Verrucomicrobiota bacterium]
MRSTPVMMAVLALLSLAGGWRIGRAQILGPTETRPPTPPIDWRDLQHGSVIPDEEYVDQPYLVRCDDGAWLCTLTTSRGGEGATSSHVLATRSLDQGKTWSPPVALEPETPPESAYSTLLKTPTGRIYVFYNFNADNIREIPGPGGKPVKRVDCLGQFVFRYSDDHGKSWSARRYEMPMRETRIDRENVTQGRVRIFWHVGRPLVHRGAVFVPFSKMVGISNLSRSEVFFLRSDNLLSEPDPGKIHWTTLPDGEDGLQAPRGIIAEEPSLAALSDGTLFCVYRTQAGRPAHAYSRDDGRTWTTPAFLTYSPGGREVKHTRAANFVWQPAPGKYLYWFHNHEIPDFTGQRNPAWIAAGREIETPAGRRLAWSQPEILLYAAEASTRMSYPDLLVEGGRYFVTETQKTIARVHEIPAAFFEQLWAQAENRQVASKGRLFDLRGSACAAGATAPLPVRFDLDAAPPFGGLTIEAWVKLTDLAGGQIWLDSRDAAGAGLSLGLTDRGTVQLALRGTFGGPGRENAVLAETAWDCDPGLLRAGEWHHVVVIVDGGARIVAFVIDGQLCDGGTARPFGWVRVPRDLRVIPTTKTLRLAPSLHGEFGIVRLYGRRLHVSEAVGNWRAPRDATAVPSRPAGK